MSRALRRHHTKRLQKKRKYYHGGPFEIVDYDHTLYDNKLTERDEKIRVSKLVNNPQMCSCIGCGNSRRWFGKTIQELSFEMLHNNIEQELYDEEN